MLFPLPLTSPHAIPITSITIDLPHPSAPTSFNIHPMLSRSKTKSPVCLTVVSDSSYLQSKPPTVAAALASPTWFSAM